MLIELRIVLALLFLFAAAALNMWFIAAWFTLRGAVWLLQQHDPPLLY